MSRKTQLIVAAARVIAGLALAVLYVIPPETLAQGPVLCPFRRLFGLECFGCGMTRAVSAALHHDFAQAMDANLMVAAALPALLFMIAAPARLWTVLPTLGRHFDGPAGGNAACK